MKRILLGALFALALVPAGAAAGSVGIGVFGGASLPVLYDNASLGGLAGVRIPINVLPMLTFEPYYSKSQLGDTQDTFGGQSYTRSGPELHTYGGNAIFEFGEGLKFYPFVGIGSTRIEQESVEDVTDTNLNFGLGFKYMAMHKLAFDLRGELSAVITGDTSRKFGNLTLGVSYALFEY
jgi:opacity protein-like surface antigen